MVETPLTLTDVEGLALARMDPDWGEYLAGGAGAERTLRENVAAFAAWRLRQRVLCGIESASTETTVLGHRVASPVVVAPVAYQRMAHPDGEEGLARAAAAVGSAFCLSTFATASPAEVAAAAPASTRFLQVYVFRDHGVTDELIAEAIEAGFSAVFLTVDLPVVGPRDRERRIHWSFDDGTLPAVRRLLDAGTTGEALDLLDPALDWAYLERLASSLPVPVVVKGILDPEDAVLAAEPRCRGHRRVEPRRAPARRRDARRSRRCRRSSTRSATGSRCSSTAGSGAAPTSRRRSPSVRGPCSPAGCRSGVSRPAGRRAPAQVLELLREELAVALHLTGCRSVADLSPACLVRRA